MTKTDHAHPLWKLLDDMQKDANRLNAKLVEVRSLVAGLELAPPVRHECPECGAVHRHSHALAEHRYHCHDGQVPEHFLAAERLAGLA